MGKRTFSIWKHLSLTNWSQETQIHHKIKFALTSLMNIHTNACAAKPAPTSCVTNPKQHHLHNELLKEKPFSLKNSLIYQFKIKCRPFLLWTWYKGARIGEKVLCFWGLPIVKYSGSKLAFALTTELHIKEIIYNFVPF